MFVSFDVADEDKGVVIFDLLHGRLGGQGVLDDVVGIHTVPARGGLARVLWSPGGPEGLWPVELHTGSDLQSKVKFSITLFQIKITFFTLVP